MAAAVTLGHSHFGTSHLGTYPLRDQSPRDIAASGPVTSGHSHFGTSHLGTVVISGDGWFYDFGDSNRAFKRDCTVYTGY